MKNLNWGGRWKTLEVQLASLMEEDETFTEEFTAFLREHLPESVTDTTTQTANVGRGAKNTNITQLKGDDNQVTQK